MPSTTLLLSTDQQRSVLNTLKANHPPQSVAYSPYGHCPTVGGLHSHLGFNGELRDPVSGHYWLGNGYRAFNPVLMRFNGPDRLSPFGEKIWNAYAYCVGDPVNLEDPTGLSPYIFKFSWRAATKKALRIDRLEKLQEALIQRAIKRNNERFIKIHTKHLEHHLSLNPQLKTGTLSLEAFDKIPDTLINGLPPGMKHLSNPKNIITYKNMRILDRPAIKNAQGQVTGHHPNNEIWSHPRADQLIDHRYQNKQIEYIEKIHKLINKIRSTR